MLASTSRPNDRIICLIDMDCFYVQVEELECPQYQGKPCGVSQYNPYKGGGWVFKLNKKDQIKNQPKKQFFLKYGKNK